MAKQYLNRASLVEGGVAPISAPSVNVPVKNIALAGQANMFGSLAQRLDAFSQVAFKEAGQQAERAGLKFGMDHAPTLADVESAKALGKPVELSGDFSSGQIFQQAAYKGSLAITETHFSTAARKALMDVVVANQDQPPEIFAEKVSSVVTEYSTALAQVDPASGAKLQNSLGIVANGNVVSHAKQYALQQKKEARESAIAGADEIKNGLLPTIKGFNYNPAKPEVTLDSILDSQLQQAINKLEAAEASAVKIQDFKNKWGAAVVKSKIEFLAFTIEQLENPKKMKEKELAYDVARRLKDKTYPDKKAFSVFWSLPKAVDRKKAVKAILAIGDQNEKARIGDQLKRDTEKEKAKDAWTTSFTSRLHSEDNKFETYQEALNAINNSPLDGGERLKFYNAAKAVFTVKKTKLSEEEKQNASDKYTELYNMILTDRMGVSGLSAWLNENPGLIPMGGNEGINFQKLSQIALATQKTELSRIEQAIKRNTDVAKNLFTSDTEVVKSRERSGGVIFNLFVQDVRRRAMDIYNNKTGLGFEKEQAVMDFLDINKPPLQQIQSMFLARLPKAQQNLRKLMAKAKSLGKDSLPSVLNVDPIKSEKELRVLNSFRGAEGEEALGAAKNYLMKYYAYPEGLTPTTDNIKKFIEERIKGLTQ